MLSYRLGTTNKAHYKTCLLLGNHHKNYMFIANSLKTICAGN